MSRTKKKLGPPPSEKRYKIFAEDLNKARPCGECQACCDAVAVHEIGKSEYTPCKHQCAAGCGIYKTRPSSCREYICAWKGTIFLPNDLELRPDHLRAIFDMEHSGKRPYLRCWQLDSPTAILDSPLIRQTAFTLATKFKMPVFAYFHQEQRSIHLIEPLLDWKIFFRGNFPTYPVHELTPER